MFLASGSNDSGLSKSSDIKKNEAEAKSMLFIALGVLGIIVFSKTQAMMIFYYRTHFAKIWMWVVVAGLCVLAISIYRCQKKTRVFFERTKRLRHLWNKNSQNILAGKISGDGTRLFIPQKARTGHVQIIGATGRGKTQSVIVPWVLRDFREGSSSILIDGKGDPSLAGELSRALRAKKNKLAVFDLSNVAASICTNPLEVGSPQQITDRIFASFEFEDPYYRELQYSICLDLVTLAHDTNSGNVTFKRLWNFLDSDAALTKAVSKSKDKELSKRIIKYLNEPKAKRDEKVSGLSSQLRPLATGELSDLVNGPMEGRDYRNLSDVVLAKDASPEILCILLPTLLYQKAAKALGRLFLQELAWSIAKRGSNAGLENGKHRNPFLGVFLDEFSAFAYRGFEQILNKARSANVALHLSHQSLGDLEAVGADFATTVNTNTNVKCILGVNDPKTADFFASHLGTMKNEKTTEQATSEGIWGQRQVKTGALSVREVDVFRVHPNDLKEFTNGQGVLHLGTPDGPVTEIVNFSMWNSNDDGEAA